MCRWTPDVRPRSPDVGPSSRDEHPCPMQRKRLSPKTGLRAIRFNPASEQVEVPLATHSRQTLDLGQALYLDLRHICLVVFLAAKI